MYPLCYSIMNLPPSLRNKMNIGLHIASFCTGTNASQKVLVEELMTLIDHPIEVDGRRYYVVVAQALFDGPGRTSYMKVRSTNSKDGCPLCDVDARPFGKGRVVYDSMRRYLPMGHPLRNKTRLGGAHHATHTVQGCEGEDDVVLQFAFKEIRPIPVNRFVYIYSHLSVTMYIYCHLLS